MGYLGAKELKRGRFVGISLETQKKYLFSFVRFVQRVFPTDAEGEVSSTRSSTVKPRHLIQPCQANRSLELDLFGYKVSAALSARQLLLARRGHGMEYSVPDFGILRTFISIRFFLIDGELSFLDRGGQKPFPARRPPLLWTIIRLAQARNR